MHGAQRIIERTRILHVLGQLRLELRVECVAAGGKPGVPAGEIAPCDRRRGLDPNGERIGHGRERLSLDLLHVVSGPRVDVPAVRYRLQALEVDVLFLDAGRERCRHIHHQARAPGEQARRHAPAAVEIAGHERFHALDRVTPVDQRPRGDAAQRDPTDFLIGVHRRVECHGRERLLLVRGPLADDFAVRLQHTDPVYREPLGAAGVGETLLTPGLRAVLIQNLNDLPVGAAAPAVGLEAQHAIVEQVDVIVVGVVRGIHRQLVDRVVPDRRVAPWGDAGGL